MSLSGKLSVLAISLLVVFGKCKCSAGLTDECTVLTTDAKWIKTYPYMSMLCQMALSDMHMTPAATGLHHKAKRSLMPITAVKKPSEKDDGYYFVRFGKRSSLGIKRTNNKKDQSNYDYIRFS